MIKVVDEETRARLLEKYAALLAKEIAAIENGLSESDAEELAQRRAAEGKPVGQNALFEHKAAAHAYQREQQAARLQELDEQEAAERKTFGRPDPNREAHLRLKFARLRRAATTEPEPEPEPDALDVEIDGALAELPGDPGHALERSYREQLRKTRPGDVKAIVELKRRYRKAGLDIW